MNKFNEWKKIILFGVIGAFGCLVGSGLGEGFLKWAQPDQLGDGITGGLMFNADFNARLQAANAQTGDVQISLMWNNRNDLDLHVVDPGGEQISYLRRRSKSGGELDVDANRAGGQLTEQPVENIYWRAEGAPLGNYKVFVNHYANHGAPDPTDFIVGILVGGAASVVGTGPGASEFPGKISRGQPPQLVHEFVVEPWIAPPPEISWQTAFITGVWTGLLAVGLSLALVIGQNHYLNRPLLSTNQTAAVVGGGLLAGLIAGGVGHVLFDLTSQHETLGMASRPIGWLILGAILGKGMAYFIANLSGNRAAIAGAIGGVISALVFAWISPQVSDLAGRLSGAGVLGFAIGLMVAIVEAAFREGWLEIRYGVKEARNVTLGLEPITIGGDVNACTVFARNAAAIAYRYKLDQGKITCEDVVRGQIATVQPGHSQTIGNLAVTVMAAGAATTAPIQPATGSTAGFTLRLSTGKTVTLTDGVKLSSSDIPGLQASNGATVAQVGRNPNDPSVLGLRNMSRNAWTATLSNRDRVQVDPGKNVRITPGTKISFGSVSAEIRN